MLSQLEKDLGLYTSRKIAEAIGDAKQSFEIADLPACDAAMCILITLARCTVIMAANSGMRKADFLLHIAEMYDDERDRVERELEREQKE